MRHEMRLHLGHEVHDDHYHDQKRRATEEERYVPRYDQELGHQGNRSDIQGTEQSETRHHFVDIASGLLAGANARQEGA